MRLFTTHAKSVTHANLGKLRKPGGGRGWGEGHQYNLEGTPV